jgi:hypothetical protein
MRLVLACLLACVAFGAQAQSNGVYKWKDARGVTHYSDTPPPSGRYGSVLPDAAAKVAAPAKADPRCTTARANLVALKGANPDLGLDANGDGKPDAPMTAEQRSAQLKLAQTAERNFCTAGAP